MNLNEKGEKFCAGECHVYKPMSEFTRKGAICDKCDGNRRREKAKLKKQDDLWQM